MGCEGRCHLSRHAGYCVAEVRVRQVSAVVRHDRAEFRVDLAQLVSFGTDHFAQIFVDERRDVGRGFVCGAAAEAR